MEIITTKNPELVPVYTNNCVYRYGDIMYRIADFKTVCKKILDSSVYDNTIIKNVITDQPDAIFKSPMCTEPDQCVKSQLFARGMSTTIRKTLFKYVKKYIDVNNLHSVLDSTMVVNIRLGDVPDFNLKKLIRKIKQQIDVKTKKILYVMAINFDGRKHSIVSTNKNYDRYKVINRVLELNKLDHDYVFTEKRYREQINYLTELITLVDKTTHLPQEFLSTKSNIVTREDPHGVDLQLCLCATSKTPIVYNTESLPGFSSCCNEMQQLYRNC